MLNKEKSLETSTAEVQNNSQKKNRISNFFASVGKVFRYEFISSTRVFLPMNAILIFLGLFNGLVAIDSNNDFEDIRNPLFSGLSIGLMVGFFYAVAIFTFITIYKRFKKSMFGNEAYLNLSLPVTISEHIIGRTLVSLCYYLIMIISSALSIFLLLIKPYIVEKKNNPHFVTEFIENFKEEIISNFNLSFAGYMRNMLFLSILGILFSISVLYAIIAIGHNIKKGRKIIKIILFFAMNWIPLAIASKIFEHIFKTSFNINSFKNSFDIAPVFVTTYIILISFTAIYFAITGFIMKKKINIE